MTLVQSQADALDWADGPGSPSRLKRDKFHKCLDITKNKWKEMKTGPLSSVYSSYVRVGPLTLARVFKAGHMINENKPAEAKHMFETWILNNAKFEEPTTCV
jgi:cathepsin A (carboxypeptidase C)